MLPVETSSVSEASQTQTSGNRRMVRYWLPVLVWLGVLALESTALASAANTSRLLEPPLHWLFPSMSHAQIDQVHHILRKCGHFIGYGTLCYLLFRAARGIAHVRQNSEARLLRAASLGDMWQTLWAVVAVSGTALVAAADELHQMTLPARTGMLSDVLLDTCGGVIFLIAVYLRGRARASHSG